MINMSSLKQFARVLALLCFCWSHAQAQSISTSGDAMPVIDSTVDVTLTEPVTIGQTTGANLNITGSLTLDIESNNSDNLVIGRDASAAGIVRVTDAASQIVTRGTNNTIQLGRDGFGTLIVDGRGSIDTLHLEIARAGVGDATITGVGTNVSITNVNGNFSGGDARLAGLLQVARDDGSDGTLRVESRAQIEIRNAFSATGPRMRIARDPGSVGKAIVDGAGTRIFITQTSPVDPRNSITGPLLEVGRDGDGSLLIDNGAGVSITGPGTLVTVSRGDEGQPTNASIDPATGACSGSCVRILNGAILEVNRLNNADAAFVEIGRSAGGSGIVEVSGAQSGLSLLGSGTEFSVGYEGTGTLLVSDGALVFGEATSTAFVGRSVGSTGTVAISGAGSTWTVGNALFIGKDFDTDSMTSSPGGTGTVTAESGTVIIANSTEIGANSSLRGGGTLRGDLLNDGGTVGELTLEGDYSQSATGTLSLEINSASDVQQLNISAGNATLAGTVALFFRNGFAPVAGQTFQLVTVDSGFSVTEDSLQLSISGLAVGAEIDVAVDPATGSLTATVAKDTQPGQPALVSSVLPTSRSVQVFGTASAFATIINFGTQQGIDCSIAPITTVPADFVYQATDPLTNDLVGTPDTPVTIEGGITSQTYFFGFTPTAEIPVTDVQLAFDCTNSEPAPVQSGINTLVLSASNTPVPDVIAIASTASGDGFANIGADTNVGAFALASANVGAGGQLVVSTEVTGTNLPVTVTLCETNAAAECINPASPAAEVTTTIAANGTPTFSVFVFSTGVVPEAPADNRVFVRFRDGAGVVRGSTSTAIRTFPLP